MAITIDSGYTYPTSTKNLAIPDWVYASNWALEAPNLDELKKLANQGKQTNEIKKQADFVNITSPLDRPATLRLQKRKIDDIYAKSGINLIHQSPIKEGYSLRWTMRLIKKISDSADNSEIYSPRQITIEVKDGINPNLTTDDLVADLLACLACYTPTGSTSNNQIAGWRSSSFQFLDETPPEP